MKRYIKSLYDDKKFQLYDKSQLSDPMINKNVSIIPPDQKMSKEEFVEWYKTSKKPKNTEYTVKRANKY